MKALSLLSLLALTAVCAQAAPVVTDKDITEDALKKIGTAKQSDSIDRYNAAKAKAEKQRADDIKTAKDITESNDRGMKKTIQKRHLNTMLPPCEREPETPREPGNYEVRY